MEIMSTMCSLVSNALESFRTPATILPGPITYMGCVSKPGVSPMLVASKIISRQSEAGAPYGPLADGSANVSEAMEAIRVEELINAVHFDGQVQVSIPPGAIQFFGGGANGGGPVTVTGTNINFVTGVGTMV